MQNYIFISRLAVFLGLFSLSLTFSQNPEQSISPPGMIYELLALNKDLPTTARPKYLSPNVIVASLDAKQLYVAEQTAKQVAVVDIATKTVVTTVKLPNEPTGIAVAPSGLLYVTCSSDIWPDGMVCEVNPVQGKVLRRLPAGHGARAPVVSPVENTLFVCNPFDNDVSVIDIGGAREIRRIKASHEPRCAVITPDGATLVVGNALPDQVPIDTPSVACKITMINAYSREKISDISLPTGSHNVTEMAISPDGKYAFVTHIIGMFTVPATKVDGGWINVNNMAIVDIKGKKILNDVTFDEAMQGTGNPWGIACSQDRKILCVAHAGSNELSILDMQQLITLADTSEYSPVISGGARSLWHNLSALRDKMEKVRVQGKSPRALTIVGNKAFIAGYFADSIEIFDLYLPESASVARTRIAGSIGLGPRVPLVSERKGEQIFIDASLCYQKWQSCHTCHPFTRPDGLNWTLRNEFAAPKNSTSMLNSWWTPPTSWAGVRRDAHESIRSGMLNELFLEPDTIAADDMDTFFMKLTRVPSPFLEKGRLSSSAVRGKNIFNGSKAGCIYCHPGPLFTDKKFHNAGILDHYDNNVNWDTPTLIECWRTAPYGHLGSKMTIQDVLGLSGMGAVTAKLTQEELSDLVEFVLSL
jgi:YVTN family beta-propeller protein